MLEKAGLCVCPVLMLFFSNTGSGAGRHWRQDAVPGLCHHVAFANAYLGKLVVPAG